MDTLEGLIARASRDLGIQITIGFDPSTLGEHESPWWAQVGDEPAKRAADARDAVAAALVAHYGEARARSRRRSFRVVEG